MSKKQHYTVLWKTSQWQYKIINKTDLSVIFLTLDELIEFKNDKYNFVELDQYMNNIYSNDPIYWLTFVNTKK